MLEAVLCCSGEKGAKIRALESEFKSSNIKFERALLLTNREAITRIGEHDTLTIKH